ncbi:MAG: hypothetical protein GY789_27215 [Hyphomicrobiales bacterium]|nr:hypothetical protein [Hyphomicrobiales bacterium]MCP5000151.1 hypothetical protein [Hyphomicrobiales bacterium]
MPLQPIADKAVDRISEALTISLSEDERAKISKIVEQAVIDSAVSASQRCAHVVGAHLEHEEDKAHQIAERLKHEETVLIANLMGMR